MCGINPGIEVRMMKGGQRVIYMTEGYNQLDMIGNGSKEVRILIEHE